MLPERQRRSVFYVNDDIKGKMSKRTKLIIAATAGIMVVLCIVVLVLVFTINVPASIDTKPKLLIDQDGGADDAMAIFMALLYEEYYDGPEVVAITTTHGNVGEEQVYNNTQRILSIAGRRHVPIYRGSTTALVKGYPSDYYFGTDGLGNNVTQTFQMIAAQQEHAAFGLIELSKKYKDNLVVVALGALTNIAVAIRIDPDFVSRLSQLYIASGNVYGENFTEPEFNAQMDAESYRIVVESGTAEKLTIVPFSQILLHQKISKEWRQDVLGAIPTKIMDAQNGFERISQKSSTYWCLLDPSAMSIALVENTVVEETVYSNNTIELCGDVRAINTNDFVSKKEANSRLIYKVKKEPFKDFLYRLFSAELVNKS